MRRSSMENPPNLPAHVGMVALQLWVLNLAACSGVRPARTNTSLSQKLASAVVIRLFKNCPETSEKAGMMVSGYMAFNCISHLIHHGLKWRPQLMAVKGSNILRLSMVFVFLASEVAASTRKMSWNRENSTSLIFEASPMRQLEKMQKRIKFVNIESALLSACNAYSSRARTASAEKGGACLKILFLKNMSLQTPVIREVKTLGLKSTIVTVECINQIALTAASAEVGAAPDSLKKFSSTGTPHSLSIASVANPCYGLSTMPTCNNPRSVWQVLQWLYSEKRQQKHMQSCLHLSTVLRCPKVPGQAVCALVQPELSPATSSELWHEVDRLSWPA